MNIILFCAALAVLVNLPKVLRSYHERRFAAAKLEIVLTVTEMEKLMLESTLTLGDVCHDRIYQNMLRSQYATRYIAPWKFWKPQPRQQEIRKRLHVEMSQNTPLAKLLIRYGNANFKAFRNNRPFASFCFILWVLLFAGGLIILVMGLFSALKISQVWKKFWQRATEEYVVTSGMPA